ncbi:serine hydrolase domain-containing protein [Amycolatopsis oliviviridis]|uniref:Serine hydrolase n=1 Tax=Amycolatopsis oliviviridis TaxID=1471590 RepID=A0ABQ3M7L1_9PSEU|nr:serine hydrolase domain-containing protein [Amycolatopsis oliviviridis]GHH35773.1 serine hydrolase [Amycolatopsis oliviviridis]
MIELKVDVDPAEVGFDAERLRRIDKHFDGYLERNLLPGYLAVVTRNGKVAHLASNGMRDIEAGLPVETDTIWRVFSMTKPVTSVAAMMLVEAGLIDLKDPISRWLPEFAEPRVFTVGSSVKMMTEPATEPIRLWHLLTHTAGLTYGFHRTHPVDASYREAGFDWGTPPGLDLAGVSEALARQPLLFQPGTEWNYSVATDILGRLVEVVSGQSLDAFFSERIFDPLGMHDTAFQTDPGALDRLAALYVPHPATKAPFRHDEMGNVGRATPSCFSGGGGLVSTAGDYHRFTQMLLRGGELDGVRLLGPRTIQHMATNHLPGGVDLETYGRGVFSEAPYDGFGFGLGFSVLDDPVTAKTLASAGEFAWGGAASTAFWVDPDEDVTVLFFTQLLPSTTYPIRVELRNLVYQALVG